MSDGVVRFTAALQDVPSNLPHIRNVALEVPEEVSRAFGARGYVPVVGTADGEPLTATLVPTGGGRHRLYLNGVTRTAIGKGVGDDVTLELRHDPSDRMPEVPEDLGEALTAAGAWAAWEAQRPSRRKEVLVTLASSKRPETRRTRIERVLASLAR